MVPLGLRVRGLLLVVVHGLLVVRPAVLLQAGLGQVAAGEPWGVVTAARQQVMPVVVVMAAVVVSRPVRVQQMVVVRWMRRRARRGAHLIVLEN